MEIDLAKILHEHDVGLVELALAEKNGFAIRRECQTTIERSWLVESEDGCGLAIRKIEEFNPAIRGKLRVQKVNPASCNVPVIPRTSVNRQA